MPEGCADIDSLQYTLWLCRSFAGHAQ